MSNHGWLDVLQTESIIGLPIWKLQELPLYFKFEGWQDVFVIRTADNLRVRGKDPFPLLVNGYLKIVASHFMDFQFNRIKDGPAVERILCKVDSQYCDVTIPKSKQDYTKEDEWLAIDSIVSHAGGRTRWPLFARTDDVRHFCEDCGITNFEERLAKAQELDLKTVENNFLSEEKKDEYEASYLYKQAQLSIRLLEAERLGTREWRSQKRMGADAISDRYRGSFVIEEIIEDPLITEHKREIRQLQETIDELTSELAERQLMAFNASHNLPLFEHSDKELKTLSEENHCNLLSHLVEDARQGMTQGDYLAKIEHAVGISEGTLKRVMARANRQKKMK